MRKRRKRYTKEFKQSLASMICEEDKSAAAIAEDDGDRYVGFSAIDTDGNIVMPFKFDIIRKFHEGKAIAEIDGKKVAIDTSGNILFELPFESFKEQDSIAVGGYRYEPGFKSGILIGYDKDDRMGAINVKGEMVIPFGKYDKLGDCQEGFIAVGNYIPGKSKSMEDMLFGYVNSQGQEIVPPKYSYTYPLNEGLGKFATGQYPNWSYGFVDTKGKVVINPIRCEDMGNFSDGLACYRVWKDGNYYGYVNKKGEKVVPPTKYMLGETFENGLAAVKLYDDFNMEYQQYFIDSSGKVVFKTRNYIPNARYVGDNAFQTGDGLLVLNETAVPSSSKVIVNNKEVVFDAYTINGNNYFKLRDIAYVVNNTDKNFSVTWDQKDGAIKLSSGVVYTPVGGELGDGDGKAK